ncbi:hypothetical protein DFH28DRAFT_986264 [Melampsora americana]|nr:hypothetical protein DFH28DRAFT_986264 [Melampsora americana]
MLQYHRETDWNSRSPSYAYESDSSDDQWTDHIKHQESSSNHQIKSIKSSKEETFQLEWKPNLPKPIEVGKPILILIGSSTKLISSHLKSNNSKTFYTLNHDQKPYVYLDSKHSILYLPNKSLIKLNLQRLLSKEIIQILNPTNKILILSTYEISTYLNDHHLGKDLNQVKSSSIKYLSSMNSKDETLLNTLQSFQSFSLPNLIQGIDAGLFLQAEMNQSDPILFLLPNQSDSETELYERPSNLSISNSTQAEDQERSQLLNHITDTMSLSQEMTGVEFDWNLFNHLKPNLVLNDDDHMRSMYV